MKYFTIDGKLYCQVKTSFIYVSTHNYTYCQLLVDRVANGGVSGEDFTVINRSPHKHVNLRGIDNHGITSVIIGTIGALDLVQPKTSTFSTRALI